MAANMPPGHPVWIEDEGINFRHLILDHDSKFTARFDEIYKGLSNAKEPIVRTGIHMPVMNSFTESFVDRSPADRHFKAECLFHFACLSLEQLNYIVTRYQGDHNNFRPHQGKGIGNRILDPDWQPPPPTGKVKRQKILGGLLNHYYREAAQSLFVGSFLYPSQIFSSSLETAILLNLGTAEESKSNHRSDLGIRVKIIYANTPVAQCRFRSDSAF